MTGTTYHTPLIAPLRLAKAPFWMSGQCLAPTDWMGPRRNVFCVDFSVGARYEQRKKGKTTFDDTALVAMRWPERELWCESGPVAT